MANGWLNPGGGWTLADWEDTAQTVLLSHLWNTLKDAADERHSFSLLTHDTGYAPGNTFPDFNNDKSVYISTNNNLSKIQISIYPESCVQTDEIQSSGTDTSSPSTLSLSSLLTGPLGYASGFLLQSSKGLPLMTWVEQYFLVMNYPEFFWRPVLTETGGAAQDWITSLESQAVIVSIDYDYDIPGDQLVNPIHARYAAPSLGATPVDFYTSGDLAESSPWSTPQEVRDYCVAELENQRDNGSWSTGVNSLSGIHSLIEVAIEESITRDTQDRVYFTFNYYSLRFRFKLADQYRANSPDRYTVPIQYNFFWSAGVYTGIFDDFGLSKTEGNVELVTITKDGNDWYNFEISGANYDNTAVPSVPSSGPNTNVNDIGMGMAVIPPTGESGQGYYMKPNQSDGSAWNFYAE